MFCGVVRLIIFPFSIFLWRFWAFLDKSDKGNDQQQKQKKGTYLPHLVAICQIHAAFSFLFLRRPLYPVRGT
jgi:hypothetical protein